MTLLALALADDLASRALSMFDALVSQGRLHYAATTPETHRVNNFTFEFRIATALLTKPHSPSSTSSAAGRPEGRSPFLVPDPAFVVTPVGAAHVLELNLHSVLRPSFVLHTRLFRPQTEDLGPADVRAVRAVMARLEGPGARGAAMMIFNCGVAAGCSQGHKHVQIFARPAGGLFPDAAASADEIEERIDGVPFKHYVLRLPRGVSPEAVYERLARLVTAARAALAACCGGEALNVVLTDRWVCVIPRRRAGSGGAAANGAGMVGMVWVKDRAERDRWGAFGYTEHLAYLGVPIGGVPLGEVEGEVEGEGRR
ncbi:hypothetical protein VD0002_g8702 [Verticillium dahliae]|nr:hypothetical protein VD0002_g8702 [Verticillium dahliae]